MKRGKKLVSAFLSVLMGLSILASSPLTVKANQAPNGFDKTKYLKSHYKSLNQKEADYQKALAQRLNKNVDKDVKLSAAEEVKPSDEVRVIVELEGKSTSDMTAGKKISLSERKTLEAQVEKLQKPVMDKVKSLGKIRHTYKNLLNGFSAVVKYEDIENIRKMTGVKKVTVANVYNLDMNTAKAATNAEAVWQEYGLKGEGTVIAIVDTGIDYTHKDMKLTDPSKAKLTSQQITTMGGPGKFYTDKVPYGYNFADMNNEVRDLGPGASMHGMHVAGISAANGADAEIADNKAIKGVAPEAQLLAMKVFTNNPDFPSAYNDDIAAAIEDSVKHGADVINMSLGSPAGFVNYNDPEQVAIEEATEAGVAVVVSAGNSYYSSYYWDYPYAMDADMAVVGSPGLFPNTLQVASSENSHILLNTMKSYINDEEKTIAYQKQDSPDPVKVFGDQKLEAVYVGTGQPQYYQGKDVAGKLVFAVRTGSYYYANIRETAEAMGAAGVIIRGSTGHGDYVNMNLGTGFPSIPFVSLSIADGNYLMNQALAGKKLEFVFTNNKTAVNSATANEMSDFSSWGTTSALEFKPEVTAPGGNIYSTVNNNGYAIMGGTSMASPHTAGATALVIQYLKKQNLNLQGKALVDFAKKLLISSAEPMTDPDAELPYLTRKQGAGLIKINKAIDTGAYVTDENGNAVIALKEVGNSKEFKITVNNFSDKELTFGLADNYGVLTNYTIPYQGLVYGSPYADVLAGAALTFSENEVIVPAKGSADIGVTLTIPANARKNIFAEGFITLESKTEGQPNLGIPYMGFYGNWDGQDGPRMFDAPMWDPSTYFGLTGLLGEGYGDFWFLGDEDSSPNTLAFSPDNDNFLDNVMPIISVMRNSKEFKVQVIDSEGNVVRDIALDKNLRKTIYNGKNAPYRFSTDWAWDGKIFNEETNAWEIAKEGQYKIRLLGKPDMEEAEWYELDMPVKLDLTAPTFDVTGEKLAGNEYKINILNPSDDVNYFGAALFNTHGDFMYDTYLDVKNGTAILEIPDTDCHILVYSYDYAGNFGWNDSLFVRNNSIMFTGPNEEDGIFLEGYPFIVTKNSTKVSFIVNDLLVPVIHHIGVTVNGGEEYDNGKSTVYTMTDLKDGEYHVNVKLYSADGMILGESTQYFIVDTGAPKITITNPADLSETLVNGEQRYVVEGTVTDASSGFRLFVNGKEVESSFGYGQETKFDFKIPVTLSEGETKVKFTAEDFVGHKAIPQEVVLISNMERPAIVLTSPEENVSLVNSKSITISGKVVYKTGKAITEFMINDEVVELGENNVFSKELVFNSYGQKDITITAKAEDDTLGTKPLKINLSPFNFEQKVIYTNAEQQNVSFSVAEDEAISKIRITVDGKEPVEKEKTETRITLTELEEAQYTVLFEALDKDGVSIVTDRAMVIVDRTIPISSSADQFGNNFSEGQIYGTDEIEIFGELSEAVKNLKISAEGKEVEVPVNDNLTFNHSLKLSDGMQRITFTMEDLAGNKNSYQCKIWVDTEAPVVEMDPTDNTIITSDEKQTFNFTISDKTFGYRLYINGEQVDIFESESGEGVKDRLFTYEYSIPEGKSSMVVKAVDLYTKNAFEKTITFYRNFKNVILFNDHADFDKKDAKNIEIQTLFNEDELTGVKAGRDLVEGTDYGVDTDKIVLHKDFLSTLPVGENTVVLTFKSGYSFNFMVNVADTRSKDATLSSIKVAGSEIEGFDSDKTEYLVELSPLVKSVPEVTCTPSNLSSHTDITQAANVGDTAVIKVTAEDGTEKVYNVKFVIPLVLEKTSTETEYSKASEATITVKGTNVTDKARQATMIVGIFDKDDKLVDLISGRYDIQANESVDMTAKVKTPDGIGYKIKCYIWDLFDTQNPLSRVLEFMIN